ncbi:hypothetical protein TNCV_865071 [Trichonephila clavipes]|nr:hypothetical protein TNCV_865071 [Trichonephila clavipes]
MRRNRGWIDQRIPLPSPSRSNAGVVYPPPSSLRSRGRRNRLAHKRGFWVHKNVRNLKEIEKLLFCAEIGVVSIHSHLLHAQCDCGSPGLCLKLNTQAKVNSSHRSVIRNPRWQQPLTVNYALHDESKSRQVMKTAIAHASTRPAISTRDYL